MSEEQDATPEVKAGHGTDHFVSANSESEMAAMEATPVEEITPDAPEEVSDTEAEAPAEAENETAAEPEEQGDDTPAENEAPKKKGGNKTQKRINDLTRKAGDANRRAEAAERELEAIKAKVAEDKPLPEPQIGDFDEYEDFIDAQAKFEKAKENPKVKAEKVDPEPEAEGQKLTDSQQTALEVVQENLKSNEDKPEDFDEVVSNNKDLQITPEMVEALSACDDIVKVAYALGKDTALAREIAGKTPVQQAREIAKLDLAPDSKPNPKPVKASKAPEPISPVGGTDAQETPLAELEYSDYEKVANARERKRTSSY